MAGTNNTAFTPNADVVAQITGTGNKVPFTTAGTYVASGNTDLTAIFAVSSFATLTTATGNSTVITSGTYNAGAIKTLQVTNDATGPRTLTFGTGFRSTGVLTGTNSKILLVQFISDGTTLNECGRSVSAIT